MGGLGWILLRKLVLLEHLAVLANNQSREQNRQPNEQSKEIGKQKKSASVNIFVSLCYIVTLFPKIAPPASERFIWFCCKIDFLNLNLNEPLFTQFSLSSSYHASNEVL